jgi:hypothetical protein
VATVVLFLALAIVAGVVNAVGVPVTSISAVIFLHIPIIFLHDPMSGFKILTRVTEGSNLVIQSWTVIEPLSTRL